MLVSKVPGGQFGNWLRQQLTSRGYDLRRGGQSRFARETDIDVSTISRALKGERMPEIDALRRIGRVLGHSLGEMLVAAGLAQADELPVHPDARLHIPASTAGGEVLADALRDLRASADAQGRTVGEMLVEYGLAAREDLAIPAALPPDPIIAEIEASKDISWETKVNLIRMHLENRAQLFEEARLKRDRERERPGD